MGLAPFRASDALNWAAALEQATLCKTIYDGGVNGVLTVAQAAGGEATEKAANRTDPDWTAGPNGKPVFVCWEQGGEYWLCIKGTYTSSQWTANVLGSFSTANALGNVGGTYHGAWKAMADAVWADVKAQIAADAKPLNVTGHSLGAAVAWMTAALARQDFPARTVRVLTIASPRPMQGNYAGGMPDPCYHVQTGDDPVVRVPPNLLPEPFPQWKQQGDRYAIAANGTLLASDYNDGELFNVGTVESWNFTNHLTTTYVNALLAYYRDNLEVSASTNALLIAAGVVTALNQPTQGGKTMSDFKRAVFQFKDRDGFTWTEVLYHAQTQLTLEKVKEAAAELLEKRCRLFSDNIQILNAYVSDDEFSRDALYITPPKPEVHDGFLITWNKKLTGDIGNQADADHDYSWTTLLLRMRSGTRTTKSMFLSGIPDFATVTTEAKLKPAELDTKFKAWEKALIDTWAWKGIAITGDKVPIKDVKSVTVVGGVYQYETVDNHNLAKGHWVTVSKTKGQNGNANGVQLVSEVVSPTQFKGNKAASANYEYLIGGKVQKRDYGIYPIQEVFERRFTFKKRGQSVGLRRGRRKTRK